MKGPNLKNRIQHTTGKSNKAGGSVQQTSVSIKPGTKLTGALKQQEKSLTIKANSKKEPAANPVGTSRFKAWDKGNKTGTAQSIVVPNRYKAWDKKKK